MLEAAVRDIRYAARALRRSPGFTAVAVLSLALGIGANAAIFSVVDTLMWKSLPVRDPERLALVSSSGVFNVSYALFEALRDGSDAAIDLAAVIRTDRYNVAVSAAGGGRVTIDQGPVRAALVSGNYFAMLGVPTVIGRTLAAADDRAGADPVVVISDAYWASRFSRAPDVVGRTLTLTGIAYDIVGVAPAGFGGEWVGRPADIWVPIAAQPRIMTEIPLGLPNTSVAAIGRLRPTVAREQAAALSQAAFARYQREQIGPNPTPQQEQELARGRIDLVPGGRGYSPQRASFGRSLTILMAAVGLVLLIACANIANLLLARSAARRRELAVRLALGAGRGRLVRQLLAESVLLAGIAGALGLLVARWATAVLASFVRADPAGRGVGLSLDLDLGPDVRWLGFTAALSLVTVVLFGLLPALRASSASFSNALTARGADAGWARGPFAARKLLVVSQVALSLVLLVSAGLFQRTLRNLAAEDLGFARDHLLLVWTLPGQTGGRGAAAADFWQALGERLSSVPGVIAAAASNQGVLNGAEAGGGSGPGLRVEGAAAPQTGVPGWRSFVSPGFFTTMGIGLVAGRDFTERDTAAAQRVVIVNQTFARHYFGDRDTVGLHVWFPEDAGAPTEIVGVVRDFTGGTPREALQRPGLTYFSYRDKEAARRLRTMTIAVRTSGSPVALAPKVRQALREADPNLPIVKIDTVDEQLGDVLIQERLMATLSAFFGGVALLLACLGLYGVISYSVGRRSTEIGIRLALGATRRGVLAMVLRESLALVAAGMALGVPVTLACARLVAARLFGVSASDPQTIAAAALTMVAVATAAAALPARRAARVDPMDTLRCE
jgi:predicted permease